MNFGGDSMNRENIAYFVDNISIAEFYCNYINNKCKDTLTRIFYSFPEYFMHVIYKYYHKPFVKVKFNFVDFPACLSLFDKVDGKKLIYFICGQGIDGLALHFVPINDRTYLAEPFYNNEKEIIRRYIRGSEIKCDAERTCQTIIETANMLNLFKTIYIDEKNLNFDEYVDKFIGKIRDYFKAPYFSIVIWEKTKIRSMMFEKRSSDDSLLKDMLDIPLREWPQHVEVKDIDEINDKKLGVELKLRNVKERVLIPVNTKFTEGYLYFFSKRDKIGHFEYELVNSIQKRISSIIDNTFFFRNLLINKKCPDVLFHNVNDTVMIVDNNRKIIDVNESFELLTGWRKERVIGRPCCDFFHSCDFGGTPLCNTSRCPMMVPLMEKKSASMARIFTIDRYGGQKVVKSNYLFEKNVMGDTTYGVAVVRDLTARVQLEKKLQRFERLASLGTFAAEVTHAIRNPITGISSNAQFLFEECNLSEKHREIVQDILRGAVLVEKTVKKLLSIAVPQNHNMLYEDINDIIKETTAILRKKMQSHNICLKKSLAEGLPPVLVDCELIKQTLMNIIINSIEAMEHGGLITITTELINSNNPHAQIADKQVKLTIADNGAGISDDNLVKIFDPFFTTKSNGSGLGLYTAYRILKDHNASIQVQSKVGKGTQTIIILNIG